MVWIEMTLTAVMAAILERATALYVATNPTTLPARIVSMVPIKETCLLAASLVMTMALAASYAVFAGALITLWSSMTIRAASSSQDAVELLLTTTLCLLVAMSVHSQTKWTYHTAWVMIVSPMCTSLYDRICEWNLAFRTFIAIKSAQLGPKPPLVQAPPPSAASKKFSDL